MTETHGRFAGRVVLVTGAGSGIGRAMATRFADEGANVAIHEVDDLAGAETAQMVVARDRMAKVYHVDVGAPNEVRDAITAVVDDFGGLDIIVNNAGINLYRHPFDYTDEDFDRIIGVNLRGPWNYCRYGGPHIADRGGGSIINVSSIAAVQASYYRAIYMASKGGVGMLTKALALDLADSNIRVNAVAPGIVKTSMTRPNVRRVGVAIDSMIKALTPLHRWADPVDIANAALFLASDEARHITGTTLFVDGGMLAGNTIGQPWHPVAEPDADLPWLGDSFGTV
jgi:3-oxoacyl-[acyl-carrier protein] reductase